MSLAGVRLVGWEDPPSQPEVVNAVGEEWYSHLRYTAKTGEHLDVVTVPKHPTIQLDQQGGTAATRVDDSMRIATAFAVDQAYEGQRDRDAFRVRAAAILSESEDRTVWGEQSFTIDGVAVQGLIRILPEGAWAIVAELTDSYLAASGPIAIPPTALAFARLDR